MQKEIRHKTKKKKEEMKTRQTERKKKQWDSYGHTSWKKKYAHNYTNKWGVCVQFGVEKKHAYLYCAVDVGIPTRHQADDLWDEGNRRVWGNLPHVWESELIN